MDNQLKEESEKSSQNFNIKEQLTSVTPLSKYLAMALVVILPFAGFYLGSMYTPSIVDVATIQTNELTETVRTVPTDNQVNEIVTQNIATSSIEKNLLFTREDIKVGNIIKIGNNAYGYAIGGDLMTLRLMVLHEKNGSYTMIGSYKDNTLFYKRTSPLNDKVKDDNKKTIKRIAISNIARNLVQIQQGESNLETNFKNVVRPTTQNRSYEVKQEIIEEIKKLKTEIEEIRNKNNITKEDDSAIQDAIKAQPKTNNE